MKERPILFSSPMVRALLDGRKTQTRRIVTVPWKGSKRTLPYEPWWVDEDGKLLAMDEYGDFHEASSVMAPYGHVGDRLWVRETHLGGKDSGDTVWYRATEPERVHGKVRWRPSIFMPRWASRLTLEITGVRVERLWRISEEDAVAEGVTFERLPFESHGLSGYEARIAYTELWDKINGERAAWGLNPFVWVVEFKRLEQATRAA